MSEPFDKKTHGAVFKVDVNLIHSLSRGYHRVSVE